MQKKVLSHGGIVKIIFLKYNEVTKKIQRSSSKSELPMHYFQLY